MHKGRSRVGSIRAELLCKSRESALTAVKVFNDPLIKFKSETFIVLMIISWTYLLHAYYRSKKIDYRYVNEENGRRRYVRLKRGAYKYWELERCLNDKNCPVDADVSNNLRFLIGLRHEIEHQMTCSLDDYLSGRYQACILNFNSYLKSLFGESHGLDGHLSYSLQFLELNEKQIREAKIDSNIPKTLRACIADFDNKLTHEQYNSPHYSFRLLFKQKLVNRAGQADRVFEFIAPDSEAAKAIDKEFWVKKEVERDKFRPTDVVRAVKEDGFTKFRIQPHHTEMWQAEDAKKQGKGYGVHVQNVWYWYQSWIDRCIEICGQSGDKYK